MLKDFVPNGRKRDVNTLVTILLYELGNFARGYHYSTIREGRERNAYLAEARLGLCDAIVVIRQIAEELGWDWLQLELDGLERFKERMRDAKNRLESKES